MKIKFWGARGSIPVPDSRMIKYGGNTTCVEVSYEDKVIIIDAGTGIRKLGEDLTQRGINKADIFITHSHWDHIQGFPFFELIYSSKVKLNIFGCTNSYKQLKTIFTNQMSSEYFPVSFKDLKSDISFLEACGKQYDINGFVIKTIQANHPIFTMGLRIELNGKSFVFITDNELLSQKQTTKREAFVDFINNADYLVHDSQFLDSEYENRLNWGHSTFEQVYALAKDANVKNLGFFHHDPNRKDDELDEIEKRFKKQGKIDKAGFEIFAVKELDEIKL
ncbi:MAG: hypothetical protein A2252_09755 [Elusimicrobia bacterium RIFOXYA2_FULL_39_19]|nr:MAG: hypothetical protein A2252_09755 [Elusimicrobia bacterium RIFOXYA2_FULL_39_19]